MDDAREITREEAIANLKMISVAFVEPVTEEQRKLIDDTFDMAIKALEQEPCENAIRREAAIDACDQSINLFEAVDRIKELPSVTQNSDNKYRKKAKRWKNKWLKARKSGKWISVSERLPEFSKEVLTCSNGGFIEIQSLEESYSGYWENQKGDWSDFDEIIAWMPLPKHYEPQESEVKEV